MKRPRMRPTFTQTLERSPERVLDTMRDRLGAPDCPVSGLVARRHVEITTARSRRHFWSPVLVVELDDDAAGGPTIRGRFAPHPNVWTGFMAIYGLLALGALGATMFGLAQTMLGWTPWALLGVPLALAVAGFTYGAVFIGQGLGADEMYELRSFVDRCIDELPERASERPPAPSTSTERREGSRTRTGGLRYD